MKDELLTIQQAADLLGVSTKTLRRWEAKGFLTPQRTIGNQRRYSKTELTILFQKEKGKAKPQLTTPVNTPTLETEKIQEEVEKQANKEEPVVNNSIVPVYVPQAAEPKTQSPLFFKATQFSGAIVGMVLFAAVTLLVLTSQQIGDAFKGSLDLLTGSAQKQQPISKQSVLAASDTSPDFQLQVNMPSIFGKKVNFLNVITVKGLSQLNGGIKTNNANINAGKGKLTASNVIYSIQAGSNITITGNKQNPTISATGGVTSFQGQTGNVVLTGGTGITIAGTTITNTDTGSGQNIFKTITAGGTNITAGSNTDQITFAAGSGISISGDAGNKTITITSNASGTLSGLTTNGILYATSGTNATSLAVGPSGTVLHGTGGVPTFSAVDLTADVTGVLPVANGGTGTGAIPTSGEILIGNGSGFNLSTLTAGAGIGISNGSGTISIANNGILSLTGTANQVLVNGTSGSAQTGAITLTLPQDIATSSTPSFAAAKFTNNTDELTLGTGNTGTITLAALSGNRFYTFPDSSGTVCLIGSGCGGAAIGGSGTTNYLAKFVDSTDVGIGSIYDNGQVGIGTTSPQGLFSVSGGVVQGALVTLNNTNTNDILTGSASGATRFVFDANGNLNLIGGVYQSGGVSGLTQGSPSCVTTTGGIVTGFGACSEQWIVSNGSIYTANSTLDLLLGGTSTVSAKFGVLNISGGTPTASIAGTGNNAAYVTGDGVFATANKQTLTIGSGSTGNIDLFGFTTGLIHSDSLGNLTSGSVNLASADVTGQLGVINGGTGLNTIAKGDLLYGSATNAISRLGVGSSGEVLTVSAGGLPVWSNPGGTLNFWQENAGALSPFNTTDDLLLGATATASAKFAFLNNAGGTPVASISAFSGNNATYLTGNGTLGTTNGQTLALGSSSTGNIALLPGGTANTLTAMANGDVYVGNAAPFGGPTTEFASFGTTAVGYTNSSAAFVVKDNGQASVFGVDTVHDNAFVSTNANASAGNQTVNSYGFQLVSNYWNGSSAVYNAYTLQNIASTTGLNYRLGFLNNAGSEVMTLDASGNLGIGATNPIASLDVNGNYGANAAAIINQLNTADIFSASASGATKFTIANDGTLTDVKYSTNGGILYANGTTGTIAQTATGNAGYILQSNGGGAPTWVSAAGVGTNYWQLNNGALAPVTVSNDLLLGGNATASADFAFTGLGTATPVASFSAVANGGNTNGISFDVANSTIQSLNKQSLTLGGSTTGNIAFSSKAFANAGLSVALGQNLTLAGITGNNQILYATSGTGAVAGVAATGLGNECLLSGAGGTPVWGSCDAGNTSWVEANGTIYPGNSTEDLLLGGTATASAKFAFVNVAANTPTASISATGVGTGLSLAGNGVIQSLQNETLTLGGSTTGNIILAPLNGATGSYIAPSTNNEVDLGTSSLAFRNIYAANNVIVNGQSVCLANGTNCPAGVNYWDSINGVLTPKIETQDILFGGQATSSAKFAFINDLTGTPTASIAGTGINALALTGDGTIQTANAQSLLLNPNGFGNVGIGTSTPNASLQIYNSANTKYLKIGNVANPTTTAALGGEVVDVNGGGGIYVSDSTNGVYGKYEVYAGALGIGTMSNNPLELFSDNIERAKIDSNGTFGIGSNFDSIPAAATLDVRGISGTTAVASISGTTAFAGLVVDNSGSGDLFTASKSGASKFTILNNGNIQINNLITNGGLLYTNASGIVGQTLAGSSGNILESNGGGAPTWVSAASVGTNFWQESLGAVAPIHMTDDLLLGATATSSAKFAFTNVSGGTPTASIAGSLANNSLYLTGNGTLATTNGQSLNIGSASTGNINFANNVFANAGLSVALGQNLTLAGITGNNQILYATSGSGLVAGVTTTSTPNECLLSGASNPVWGACDTGNTSWVQANGTIYPGISTEDLLVGGTSTASAKFAFINVAGNNTPTASISGTGSNALALTGNGTIQTANGQSLLLNPNGFGNVGIGLSNPLTALDVNGAITTRGSSAGLNIFSRDNSGAATLYGDTGGDLNFYLNNQVRAYFSPNGRVGIGLNNTTPQATLDVTGTGALGGTIPIASLSGQTSFAGLLVDNSGSGDLFTASKSGASKFTITNAGNIVASNYAGTNAILYASSNGTFSTATTGIAGQCLLSGGSSPTWGACDTGNTSWVQANGTIYPGISTEDLLVGGTSTASAKFALTGVSTNTPVASLSGSTGATYLSATGNLATTNRLTLALGGNGTGNISLQDARLSSPVFLTQTATGLDAGLGTNGIIDAINKAYEAAGGSGTGGVWTLSGNVIYPSTIANQVGIGTTAVGNGEFVVNQPNSSGDIFAASASGATKFVVANNGSLEFTGGTGFLNTLSVSNSISSAQTYTLPSVGGTICTFEAGNCSGSGTGVTQSGLNASGQIAYFTNSDNLTSSSNFLFNNSLSVTGASGNAAAIINQLNSEDIFSASASGVTKFTIANDGTITDAKYSGGTNAILYATSANGTFSTTTTGTSNQCLLSGPSGPSWGPCDIGNSSWVESNGTIYPGNTTEDLLVGGNATASAKFAFVNVSNGTPTASISAVSQGTGLSLAGNGVIQSLQDETLTLGGSTTGNIILAPLNGATGSYIAPSTNNQVDLGTSSLAFRNIYAANDIKVGGVSVCLANGTNCPAGVNYWDSINGVLTPKIETQDILFGGQATSSAKFAFINDLTGTPTASIAGSTTNNSLYLTGNGTLGTTNAQTLTLGSASTGNININSNGSNVASFSTANNGTFTLNNINATGNLFTVSNSDTSLNFPRTLFQGGKSTNDVDWIMRFADSYSSSSLNIPAGIQLSTNNDASYTNTNTLDLEAHDSQMEIFSVAGSMSPGVPIELDTSNNGDVATPNLYLGTAANGYQVGIGTKTMAAQLDVRGQVATLPIASFSGATTNAGLIVDNSGLGDLFTASRSGATKFVVANNGNVGIGTATPTSPLTVNGNIELTPIAGVSSDLQLDSCCGGNSFTLRSATGGLNFYATADVAQLDQSGELSLGIGNGQQAQLDVQNSNYTLPGGYFHGSSGKAMLLVDQSGVGDLFTASLSGVSKFTITNSGSIVAPSYAGTNAVLYSTANGTFTTAATGLAGQCLLSGGSNPTWGACDSGNTSWVQANGTIYPGNSTEDLLVGGTSTASAKFAFINVAGNNTPTASISAGISGATYLTANGTLGTTNGQSLALGSASTGNIVLSNSAFANAGLTVASGQNLTLAGLNTNNNSVLYTNGTGVVSAQTTTTPNQCLLSGVNTPIWGACDSGNTSWVQANGTIYPGNSTEDLLLGGTSTASAKFAFINVAGNNTPTASISGATGALSLAATGTLGTTNGQTLTLGSGSTGNVSLLPGGTAALTAFANGYVGIGTTNPQYQLDIQGSNGNLNVGGKNIYLGGTLRLSDTTAGETTISPQASSGNGILDLYDGTNNENVKIFGSDGSTNLELGAVSGNSSYITSSGTLPLELQSFGGSVGIGTTHPLASTGLDIEQNSLGNSALVVNNIGGGGDIFTASSAGVPEFVINNTGSVGIGTTTPVANLQVGARASTSTPAWIFAGSASNNTNGNAAFVGNWQSNNLWGFGPGTNIAGDNTVRFGVTSSNISNVWNNTQNIRLILNGNLGTSALAALDVRAATATLPVASISGATTNAVAIVDQSGSGDLFTASRSGASKFTILNNGNLQLNNYTAANGILYTNSTGVLQQATTGSSNLCLLSGASTPTWGACDSGNTSWVQSNGTIYPGNSTEDLLVGGTSTASAKFAFINVAGNNTPTASISGTAGNALALTGNGTIQTATAQSLLLNPNGFGNVGIGTTNPAAAKLTVSQNSGADIADFFDSANNRLDTINQFGDLTLDPSAQIYANELQSQGNNLFVIGGNTTGAITFEPQGLASGQSLYLASNGTAGIGTTTPLATLDLRGNSATTPAASVSGASTFANFVVDQSGSGDLFTASKSGASKFTILNNGNLQLNNYTSNTGVLYTNGSGVVAQSASGTSGQVLELSGSTPTWVDAGAAGLTYWQLNNGALAPFSTGNDLLLGGISTSSAKFAFINNATGIPTASISANSSNNATYITGNGILGTTNAQTLTLGSATTGNININPAGSNVATFSTANNGTLQVNDINDAGVLFKINSNLASTHFPRTLFQGGQSSSDSNWVMRFADAYSNSSTAIDSGIQLSTNNDSNYASANTLGLYATSTSVFIDSITNSGSNGVPIVLTTSDYLSNPTNHPNLFLDTVANGNLVGIGTNTPVAQLDVRGQVGTNPIASLSGATTNAGLIVDNSGLGDLFTASKSGATKFTINNAGNIIAPNYNDNNAVLYGTAGSGLFAAATTSTSGQCLLSGVSNAPVWGACDTGNTSWVQANGTIYPGNSTEDLLIGGTSTASAKFAFINVAGSNTPTASISGTSNNATYITGNGTLGTTNNQSLILGSSTTGNVSLVSGGTTALTAFANGNVGIGTTAPNARLNIAGATSDSSTNAFTVADATSDTLFNVQDDGTLSLGVAKTIFGNSIIEPTTDTGSNGTVTSDGFTTGVSGMTITSMSIYIPVVDNTNKSYQLAIYADSTTCGGPTHCPGALIVHSATGTLVTGWNTIAISANLSANTEYWLAYFSNTGVINTDNPVYTTGATNQHCFDQGQTFPTWPSPINAANTCNNVLHSIYAASNSGGTPAITVTSTNNVGVNTTTPLAALDVRSNGYTTPVASLSGQTGQATLIVDNSGNGDLFTASSGGVPHFTIQNNGSIVDSNYTANNGLLYTNGNGVFQQLAAGTSNQCLEVNAGGTALNWATCAQGTNYWQLNNGALAPANITDDLLLGGTSTASARFAFINNIGSGTPTASISANSGSNATYLTGNGTLGTTNAQTLTLGSATTGNVLLTSGGAGSVAINTPSISSTSGSISLQTGNSSNGNSGNISITTGNSSTTAAGSISIDTGTSVTSGTQIEDDTFEGSGSPANLDGYSCSYGCGTFTSTTSQFHGGSRSLASGEDSSGDGWGIYGSYPGVAVTAGHNYAFTVWVRGTTAESITAAAQWSGSGDQSTIGTVTDTTSGWTEISGSLTAPAGSTGVYVGFFGGGSGTSGQTNYFDDVTVTDLGTVSAPAINIGATNAQAITIGNTAQGGYTSIYGGADGISLQAADSGLIALGTVNPNILEIGAVGATFINDTVHIDDSSNGNGIVDIGGNATNGGSGTGTTVNLQGGQTALSLVNTGATVQTFTNSTSAFQVQNAAGNGVLTIGTTATSPVATIAANTSFAGLVVDQAGSGDIFTASKSGKSMFTITNAGGIELGNNVGMLNQCLLSGGAGTAASWGSCAQPTNYWQLNGTVISQANTTDDLTLGGTSTASAKFAFIGNAGAATPIASISAQNTNGTGLVLSGTGAIQTLYNNTLTIGGNTTGNIQFEPGNNTNSLYLSSKGTVGIGTTNPLATLDIRANSAILPIASIAGATTNAGLIVDNSGTGAIFSASSSGLSRFTVQQNGNILLGQNGVATANNVTISGAQTAGSNTTGGNLTLAGSNGTGTGGSGSLNFQVAAASTTAPQFDTEATAQQTNDTAHTLSWNHTVGNGGNRILIVDVAVDNSKTVSAVTYGNQSLTQLSSEPYESGTQDNEMWYLVAPKQGTYAVSVTISGTADIQAGSEDFYNVNQSSPFGTVARSNNGDTASTNPNVTVSSGANQLVIDHSAVDTGAGYYNQVGTGQDSPNGQTPVWQDQVLGEPNDGASYKAGTASTSMQWTLCCSLHWSEIGVALQPVTATIADGYQNALTIASNGNIGIGTQNPTANLSVAGSISNLTSGMENPTQIASNSAGFSTNPTSMAVQGKYAYVVDENYGLVDYDITNPSSPQEIGTLPGYGGNIVVQGNYAYLAGDGGGLKIIDISNPASPKLVGASDAGMNYPSDIWVQGKYVYISDYNSDDLLIFDVSNPANPVLVGSTTGGGDLVSATSVKVQGRYAYVTTWGGGIYTIDISNPTAPVLVGAGGVGSESVDLAISGEYAYVTDFLNGLIIYNISNPTSPTFEGKTFSGLAAAGYVSVSGRYAYVSDFDYNTLNVYDVSNPTEPLWVGSSAVGSPLGSPGQPAISGQNVFLPALGPANGTTSPGALLAFNIGGIETTAIMAHAAELGQLNVDENASIMNQLSVGGGLNVGTGGIYTSGAITGGDLTINGTNGTTPNASISGNTSFAGLLVDNSGNGDLFTASSSGLTRFVINQIGNVGIGVPEQNLNSASEPINVNNNGLGNLITGGGVQIGDALTGIGTVAIAPRTGQSGTIMFYDAGNNDGEFYSDGNVFDIGANESNYIALNGGFNGPDTQVGIDTPSNPLATFDVRSNTFNGGTIAVASVSGTTSFAGLLVDNSGSGDIFTASKSGATKFTITNAGNIIAPNYNGNNAVLFGGAGTGAITAVAATGTGGLCLLSGTGIAAPTWGNCVGGNTTWQEGNGAIYAGNTTEDLLLGGTATTSAEFAVTGIAGTTPAASISAVRGNKNGISLDASSSTIQSLNKNTLVLGGTTTGNIQFEPGNNANSLFLASNGNVGIGATTPLATLDVRGNIATTPIASFSGATTFANTVIDQSGSGDLFTASKSGATKFTIKNNGQVVVGSTTTFGATLSQAGTYKFLVSGSANTDTRMGITAGGNAGIFYGTDGTTARFYGYNYGNSTPLTLALNEFGGGIITGLYATPLASLDVRATSGTQAIASVSGATTNAGLIVDNSGSGDIFTASVSGATKFVINNAGNVGIGTSAPVTKLDITSATGNGLRVYSPDRTQYMEIAYDGANVALNGHGQSLILSDGSNDGIFASTFFSMGNNSLYNVKNLTVGNSTITALATADIRATNGTLAVASISGNTTFANTVIDQSGTGDIFTASKSGATKFTINNAGNIIAPNYAGNNAVLYAAAGTGAFNTTTTSSNGLCLLSQTGGTPTWGNCVGGNTTWQEGNGAIYAGNTTEDLLLGGTATSSAGFAVTGIAGTTPQATISAVRGNKNGISLNASTSTIQSLNNNTLILGGTTTGDIAFRPGGKAVGNSLYLASNGNVGIGVTNPNYELTVLTGTTISVGTTSNSTTTPGYFENQDSPNLAIGAAQYVGNWANATQWGIGPATNSNTDQSLRLGITNVGTNTWDAIQNVRVVIDGANGKSGLAALDVGAATATLPIASLSGSTNFAGLVVDQSGTGDIFTASSSGMPRFTIQNNGSVYIANQGASAFSNTGLVNILPTSIAQKGLVIQGLAGQTADLLDFYGNSGFVSGYDAAGNEYLDGSLHLNGASGGFIQSAANENLGLNNNSGTFVGIGTTNATNFGDAELAVNQPNAGGDIFTASQSGSTKFVITNSGNVGIGTALPGATLDVRGNSGTKPTATVSASSTFAGMVVDQSGTGDIFTASKSGATKFTIQNSGTVVIGNTTNGITFDPTGNTGCGVAGFSVFCGTARPTKTITLTAEYAGVVLSASPSAGLNTNGFMTSDASYSATPSQYNHETYYQWTSTQSSLQSYNIAVTVTLPKDWSAWPSSGNAMTIDYNTGLTTSADNALDVYMYKKSDTTGVPVYFSTNNTSQTGNPKTWTQVQITGAQLTGSGPKWNGAGQQVTLYLSVKAKGNIANYVQVGDININYLSAF